MDLDFDLNDYIYNGGDESGSLNITDQFDAFMTKHKVVDDDKTKVKKPFTHTRMDFPYGKYNIDDKDYDTFLNLYKKVITTRLDSITEKQKDIGPLLIDIDFRQKKEDKDRKYRDDHIEEMIKYIVDILTTFFKINKKDIEALVFEKDDPSFDQKQNNYKDGYHIIFPNGFDIKHRFFIFEKLKEKCIEEKLLEDIPFINTIEEIFDVSTINRNGWLMYRSKKRDGKVYKLTNIYDANNNKKRKDLYDHKELVVHLAVRKYTEDDKIELKQKEPKTLELIDEIYNKYNNPKIKNKEKDDKIINQTTDIIEKKFTPIKKLPCDKAFITNLVNILSVQRATEYLSWISVGWCLFNISPSLLDVFKTFSQKCGAKYNEHACVKVWNNAREQGYGMPTLIWWAKCDNEEQYRIVMRDNINKLIAEAENGTHDDIAKVIYELYHHTFRCASIKKNIWYEFQGHRWIKIDNGYTLQNIISDELTKEFSHLMSNYYLQLSTNEVHGQERDRLTIKTKNIAKIIEKLKTHSFKQSVITECSYRFYQKNFEELLDENRDLIGFDNGVYDLKNFKFRGGVPDDMVSFSVGYDYPDHYTDTHPMVIEIQNFWKQLHIQEDMRDYVLTSIAAHADGHNRNQKFPVWTGVGCHAPGTGIIMIDGSIKKVEDVKINDLVMGDDNHQRRVIALFKGNEEMYKIHLDNGDSFIVNKSHRLAFRNLFNITIIDDTNVIDDHVFTVCWYEYIENIPMMRKKSFNIKQEATKYLNFIKNTNEFYINLNETVPITVSDYINLDTEIKKHFIIYNNHTGINTEANNILLDKLIQEYGQTNIISKEDFNKNERNIRSLGYRLDFIKQDSIDVVMINKNRNDYTIINIELMPSAPKSRITYYGFELDGNKRYMIDIGMVTYNSNGKSTVSDLIQRTFGDYYDVLPTTVLTLKRKSSSGATPELADKRGKRFVFIQEPEHDDVVYVGQMKNLTGSDWIPARALYGDPFKYKPQFKMTLVCNKLPFIPSNDGGTWRRLRVVPWESKFTATPDPNKPNEFALNGEIEERLKLWNQPFMWLLLNKYYKDYRINGIKEPAKVREFTDKYKSDSDIFYEYIKSVYIITGNSKDRESLTNLYEGFRVWFKTGHGNGSCPTRKEMQLYFEDSTEGKYTIKNGIVGGVKQKDFEHKEIELE